GETCDQCTNSHYLTADHWCEDACPDGYYKNGTGKLGRRCLTCPAGISKCISPTVATECRDAKYLTTHGACVDACPDGTYPTGHSSIGRTCQVCEASCAQCTQANICLQCKNGWYLTADLWCEEGCPDGYFRKGTDNALGRSCAPCPENALKCIGPALITECRNWLYLTPDGTCAPGCPQGKYLTPSSWCEASCPHGTYKNGTGAIGNTCDPCPGDYSACIHPTYATECKHAKFLTPDAACRDTCPQGYFQEGLGELGRHCPRCHENCKSCSAPALCTVCDNGKFLSPNMWCDDTCPDGYYRNGSGKIGNTCPACPKHASKCLNASHSIECKDSRYLTPDFTCEVDCPRGLFQKGATTTGRVCSQCPSNCTLCVKGTACRECRNNLYLTPKFLCEAECPSDHYYEPASSLKQIDWKKLPDHSCGGNELWQWSGGGDSKYGEQFVDNLVGCQLMCMARAECAAFEMRDDSNSCSFWKAEPLAPKATKGIHCFQKVGLVPKKAKATTGEVVLPAAGIASMSSSLESTLPRLCNDGLVATRCSSTWNEVGQYAESQECLEVARSIREQQGMLRTPEGANLLRNLGVVHCELKNLKLALDTCLQAREIREESKTLETPDGARLLSNLAAIRVRKYLNPKERAEQDLDLALSTYEEAKNIFKVTGTLRTDEGAQLLGSEGNAFRVRKREGDLQMAVQLYEEAKAIREENRSLETPDGARLLSSLALAYIERKDPERAIENFKEARRCLELTGTLATEDGAKVLQHFGETLNETGRVTEALEALDHAKQIRDKAGTIDCAQGRSLQMLMRDVTKKVQKSQAGLRTMGARKARAQPLGDDSSPEAEGKLLGVHGEMPVEASY
ncbi:unnamed protein product, partial [Durusdinium trenchii]